MVESGFERSSAAEQQFLPPERTSRPLWPWIALLAALVVVLLAWSHRRPQPRSDGEQHAAVGKKLPTFELEPLTGESRPVSEADLDGKVSLVNFWGPWCGACAIEFPKLVELEQHFRDEKDFQFFSVSSNFNPLDDEGLVESTEQFLKHHGADFPTYRDPQAKTKDTVARVAGDEYMGAPTTVLIGPDRAICGLWVGYAPGDEVAVRQAIEKALRK